MNALWQKLTALLVRSEGRAKPSSQPAAVAKPALNLRAVQDVLYIDLFGKTIRQGDQVVFFGTKDDWNAIVQATANRFPIQSRLDSIFRWRKDTGPISPALGYLEAIGNGWDLLRQQNGETATSRIIIYFHLLSRRLDTKLDLRELS